MATEPGDAVKEKVPETEEQRPPAKSTEHSTGAPAVAKQNTVLSVSLNYPSENAVIKGNQTDIHCRLLKAHLFTSNSSLLPARHG